MVRKVSKRTLGEIANRYKAGSLIPTDKYGRPLSAKGFNLFPCNNIAANSQGIIYDCDLIEHDIQSAHLTWRNGKGVVRAVPSVNTIDLNVRTELGFDWDQFYDATEEFFSDPAFQHDLQRRTEWAIYFNSRRFTAEEDLTIGFSVKKDDLALDGGSLFHAKVRLQARDSELESQEFYYYDQQNDKTDKYYYDYTVRENCRFVRRSASDGYVMCNFFYAEFVVIDMTPPEDGYSYCVLAQPDIKFPSPDETQKVRLATEWVNQGGNLWLAYAIPLNESNQAITWSTFARNKGKVTEHTYYPVLVDSEETPTAGFKTVERQGQKEKQKIPFYVRSDDQGYWKIPDEGTPETVNKTVIESIEVQNGALVITYYDINTIDKEEKPSSNITNL